MHKYFAIEPAGDPGPAVSPRERLQRTIAELQRQILHRAATIESAGMPGGPVDDRAAFEADPRDREAS